MSDDKIDDKKEFRTIGDIKKANFKLTKEEQKALDDSIVKAIQLQKSIVSNPDILNVLKKLHADPTFLNSLTKIHVEPAILTAAKNLQKENWKNIINQSIKLTNTLKPITLVPLINTEEPKIRSNVIKVVKSEEKEIEPKKIETKEDVISEKNLLDENNRKLDSVLSVVESIRDSQGKHDKKLGEILENTNWKLTIPLVIGTNILTGFIVWYATSLLDK